MSSGDIHPKYNLAVVESAVLEVAAELHPQHLASRELVLRIVDDAEDGREVDTAIQAIRQLREFGLLRDRDDGIVELTQAALRCLALRG